MTICAICGSPRKVENAHIDPKKIGGRGAKAPESAHDTVPLCAGTGGNTDPSSCHGANEAGYIDLRPTCWSLTTRAPKVLKKRLKAKVGHKHPYLFLDTDPDAIDEPRSYADADEAHEDAQRGLDEHTLAVMYAEVAQADYTVFRCRAERLALARDWFGDKGEFRRWRLELTDMDGKPIPVTDAQASRMLTVVDNLPEDTARDLPAQRQYLLARAIHDGAGSVEELLPHAESLTARAFEEQFLGREEYTPPQGTCPDCGHEAPLADFKRSE